ncbi:MAG: efflux RND transporter periplasmic adaptor subunit [Bryobacteraceae bacterium]
MKRRPKQWLARTIVLILVAAIVIVVWSRLKGASAEPNLPTAVAKQGEFRVLVRCRGELKAARKVELIAPVDVQDLQIVWLAPAGGMVKAGAVVIRFDPSKVQQDLREKTEALKGAQATLDQAISQENIDADKDRLDLSQMRADSGKAQLEASKQAIVSAIQGQESTIDYHLAQEKVAVQITTAALHKESNDAKIASQRRLRDQAQAEVDLAKRRLAQLQVTSPIAGLVSYMANTTQGWMNTQNYKVGDHASPGVTIAEIPDLNTLEMESKVDEEDRGRIAVGDDVAVHVDALPEKTMNAKLTSISLLTEQSFEEWPPLRTFRAFAAISHPDAALRPGMNAGADIVERKIPTAISIPSRALFTVNSKPTVYVKTGRAFVAHAVTITGRNPDEVAIAGIPGGTVVALLQPPEAAK